MAPMSATGALPRERSRMTGAGASEGAKRALTFPQMTEHEARPPPTQNAQRE